MASTTLQCLSRKEWARVRSLDMLMPRVEFRRLPTIQVLPQECRVGARLTRVATRRQGRRVGPAVTT